MTEHNGTVRELTARARSFAERLQSDECTITVVTGEMLSETGSSSESVSELYAGQCRVRPRQVQDRMTEVGADEVGITAHVVTVPISVVDVPPGAVVEITASASDPDLVERRFTVLGSVRGSQISGRRLTCEEVTT